MNIKKYLKELTQTYGVSGNECPIAKTAEKYLSKYCDEIAVDKMGNLIGKINGKKGSKKIMLEAHMDQVGFLVSDIDDEGNLSFVAVGGIDHRILPGLKVKIFGKETVNGVITVPKDGAEKNAEIKDLKIFTGFPKEALLKKISIGDHIIFDYDFTELMCNNLCSGAMDNRSGMAVMISALGKIAKTKPENDIYIVFSTQEEVGLRGAYTSCYGVEPDMAVVVDVTHGTTADSKDDSGVFDLGSGAVILRGPNVDYSKTLALIELAKKNKIDYKIEVAGGASGTTAWAIQTVGKGVPVMLISIPLRYMHTNVEVLKEDDLRAAAELVAEAVSRI